MERQIIVTGVNGNTSQILIGDVLGRLPELLPDGKVVVITDATVHRLYGKYIDPYPHIIIGMGETNKTLSTLERIYRELIETEADRHTFILGFGGGIVTDVAGFAASTFMRGVPFGFVSTTLLSQVDASIGGKNGVNLDGFKNMIGCFSQPRFVLCDTTVLDTLPEKEFRSGLAEIVKAGIIGDPALFEKVSRAGYETLRNDKDLLTDIIESSIQVKAAIVNRDERETGVRKLLNLGHTFGHAIEKLSSAYTHGEAVAIGIRMAGDLALSEGELSAGDHDLILSALRSAGLPSEAPIEKRKLVQAMRSDKKKEEDGVDLILPAGIGECRVRRIGFEELAEKLK